MVLVRRLAYVASLFLIPACGQSLNKPPTQPTNDGSAGGGGSAGGKGGDGSAGGGGTTGGKDMAGEDAAPPAIIDMAGFNQAGAPVVVITAPTAGLEIHGDVLTVTATITSPTNAIIQASSVELTVTPPGGAVATAPLTLTPVANVYSGKVSLPDDASGPGTFTVAASDTAGLKGSAQGTYVHDHGPILSFVAPTGMTPVKGTQTISVEITVNDTLHPITDVSQVSAGIRTLGDIKNLQAVTGANPFTVYAMVDLKTYGTPALDGSQLIKAQAESSTHIIGQATQPLIIDNTGPVINITAPLFSPTSEFVSGVTQISADITDALSPIDDSTVVAVWGGDPTAFSVPLTRSSSSSTTYTGTFDVRSLGTHYVQPTLSVRASDTLGNQTAQVTSFFVDNTRPWVSMDAALQVQVAEHDGTTMKEGCSEPFSPLGPDVVLEGVPTPLAITLRTRVEDQGNDEPNLSQPHVSGIDTSANSNAVVMYVVQDDGNTTLAVDTDNDTICDDVNPQLVPTTDVELPGEALTIRLVPIAGSGQADFRVSGTSALGPGCEQHGLTGATFANAGICDTTSLIFNVNTVNNVNEIFAPGPVADDKLECVGTQLDGQNHNLRGPICIVTRVVDNAGNINVSYPLHTCVIDPANPSNCAGYVATATHCTGVWDPVAQKLGAGFCYPPPSTGSQKATFADGDVIKQL
jgi:hypothetical protein